MNFIGYALLKDKEEFLSDKEISFRELVETSAKKIDYKWEDILLDKISEFGYSYVVNEEIPNTLAMLSKYAKISNADVEDIYDTAYKVYENFNETGEFDEAGFEKVDKIFKEKIKSVQ